MWPVLVVVAAVDAEHVFEVAAAEDQDPVEAVGAESRYPAFGVGVCVRCLHRCPDHLHSFGAEDFVEGVTELRVAITDEEPKPLLLAELDEQIAACWVTQPRSGFLVQALYSIRRFASEMKKNT